MNTQQIYNSNTDRAFPLKEQEDLSVLPFDVIVDMSLTLPEGIEPVITAVSITTHTLFIALEDNVTKKAIGHISSNYAAPYDVLKFNTIIPEASGWLVTGPGIAETKEYPNINEGVDESVIIRQPTGPVSSLTEIEVNGISGRVSGVLDIASLTDTLIIGEEIREIEGVMRDCIVLLRNDSSLSKSRIYTTFTENVDRDKAIRSIGGVKPDSAGNVEIRCESNVPLATEPFTVTPIIDPADIDNPIGLLFYEQEELCSSYPYSDKILHGRCEQGIVYALPCDDIIETLYHPEFKRADCGCDESEG